MTYNNIKQDRKMNYIHYLPSIFLGNTSELEFNQIQRKCYMPWNQPGSEDIVKEALMEVNNENPSSFYYR